MMDISSTIPLAMFFEAVMFVAVFWLALAEVVYCVSSESKVVTDVEDPAGVASVVSVRDDRLSKVPPVRSVDPAKVVLLLL